MRTRRSWRNQERLWRYLGGTPREHKFPAPPVSAPLPRAAAPVNSQLTGDDARIVELALGRIFRMGSRPAQPGDVAEYERCRAIIMQVTEEAACRKG